MRFRVLTFLSAWVFLSGAHACQVFKVLRDGGGLSLPNRPESSWFTSGRHPFNLFMMPGNSEEGSTNSPGFDGVDDVAEQLQTIQEKLPAFFHTHSQL